MTEIELYSHMTDEEFEIVRLNKLERCREILKNIKVRIFVIMFDIINGIEVIFHVCSFSDNLCMVSLDKID